MEIALPIGIRVDEEGEALVRELIRDIISLCMAYAADEFERLDEIKDMVEMAPGYPGEIGKQILGISYPRGYVMGFMDARTDVSRENREFLAELLGVVPDNIDVDGRFDEECSTLLAASETTVSDPMKSGFLVGEMKEKLTSLYEAGYFYGTRDGKLRTYPDLEDRVTEFREALTKLGSGTNRMTFPENI